MPNTHDQLVKFSLDLFQMMQLASYLTLSYCRRCIYILWIGPSACDNYSEHTIVVHGNFFIMLMHEETVGYSTLKLCFSCQLSFVQYCHCKYILCNVICKCNTSEQHNCKCSLDLICRLNHKGVHELQ